MDWKQLLTIARDLAARKKPGNSQKELYHYTDLPGFVGIVGHRSLWASDMRCLEDVSEASYAYRMIKQSLTRNFRTMPRADREAFLQSLAIGEYGLDTTFVACFCERNDLLSQWRGYGGRGEGLAVGFKTDWLSSRREFDLRRVRYRRSEQTKLIADFIQHRELLDRSAVDAHWFWLKAAGAIEELVPLIKHPAFEREQEWRLVSRPEIPGGVVRFRQSGSRVVPYIELRIPKCAIASVKRGPYFAGSDDRGIRQMLQYRGFLEASAHVRDSKVPIRR